MAAPMNTAGVPQWEADLLNSPEYAARQAALSVLTRKADIDQSDQSTAWLVPYALLVEIVTAAVDAAQPILEQTARRQVAAEIRAQAEHVPLIPLQNGSRLRPGSAVEWAARIAEGVDGG